MTRHPQFMFISALTYVLFGIVLIFVDGFLIERESPIFTFVGLVLVLVGSGLWLYMFLMGVRRVEFNSSESSESPRVYRYFDEHLNSIYELVAQNYQLLDEFKNRQLDDAERYQKIELSSEERGRVLSTLQESIEANLTSDLFENFEKKYADNVLHSQQLTTLMDEYRGMRDRIEKEISALTRRATSNLTIGTVTTIFAVVLLGYVVLNASTNYNDFTSIVSYYLPRLSLVVFIELFAYFFLRLYSSNLGDIKYYQNELTNIETKFLSLRSALGTGDAESVHLVLSELSKTERNYRLSRGESTVELEKAKLEDGSLREFMEFVSRLIRRTEQR